MEKSDLAYLSNGGISINWVVFLTSILTCSMKNSVSTKHGSERTKLNQSWFNSHLHKVCYYHGVIPCEQGVKLMRLNSIASQAILPQNLLLWWGCTMPTGWRMVRCMRLNLITCTSVKCVIITASYKWHDTKYSQQEECKDRACNSQRVSAGIMNLLLFALKDRSRESLVKGLSVVLSYHFQSKG